jgi:ribosomal protein L40E
VEEETVMSIEVPLGRDINLKFNVLENNGALLCVRYEVENVSISDLYLFNRLWHDYTEQNIFELDANLVYISARGNTGRLLKGIPDIPANMHVEMPIIPCVTVLQRGQRMDETLQIELPLRQLDPYKRKERPSIQNPTAMVFSLGYFRASEIGKRPVNYVRSTMGQALYAYVTPWDQLIVSTAPVPLRESSAPTGEQKFCTKCGAKHSLDNRFCSQCGSQL